MVDEKFSLENLMRRFIKNQTGKEISNKTPRTDLIKCLLQQEFDLNKVKIPQMSEQKLQVVYGHIVTSFPIKFYDYFIDILVAENNSGFIMFKTQLGFNELNEKPPFLEKPIYNEAAKQDFFKPLIKFFDDIMGRNKLIDFKFIPEEYQKHYKRGDRFLFSEIHLWENDELTATEIVEDLYRQRFNSSVSGPFFEAKYNDGYNNSKLKLWTWNKMIEKIQSAENNNCNL